jgi:hypothetical protein
METWKDTLKTAAGLQDAPGITMEQAANIPYSSLGYRIGSSAEGLLVLATDNSDTLLWTSSNRRALATRNGRIVKSANFGFDLTDTRLLSSDPFGAGPLTSKLDNYSVRRLCDFADISHFGNLVEGSISLNGKDTIEILGASLTVLTLVENCRSEDLDWRFKNIFWIDDATGFVWKSVQHIHPDLPPLTVEILRPPM